MGRVSVVARHAQSVLPWVLCGLGSPHPDDPETTAPRGGLCDHSARGSAARLAAWPRLRAGDVCSGHWLDSASALWSVRRRSHLWGDLRVVVRPPQGSRGWSLEGSWHCPINLWRDHSDL